MSEMNRDNYKMLIMQDIAWMKEYTHSSMEHHHIIDVLKESVDLLYPPKPESEGAADKNAAKYQQVSAELSVDITSKNINLNGDNVEGYKP